MPSARRPRASIRQDSPGQNQPTAPGAAGTRSFGFTLGPTATGQPRRGSGFAVDLPAYENDVLNALALTGGLPGSDAVNEIVIYRGSFRGDQDRAALLDQLGPCGPEGNGHLFGGDPALLYESLTQKLAKVPDDAVLFPGHLYSAEPSASMGDTRKWNFVFAPKSEREWLAMFGR